MEKHTKEFVKKMLAYHTDWPTIDLAIDFIIADTEFSITSCPVKKVNGHAIKVSDYIHVVSLMFAGSKIRAIKYIMNIYPVFNLSEAKKIVEEIAITERIPSDVGKKNDN